MSIDHTAEVPSQHSSGGHTVTVTGGIRSGRRPLADVALTMTDQTGAQVARGTSTPDGRFEFRAVRPGSYLVIAAVDGYQPHAEALTVRPHATDSLDIVLEPAAGVYGVVRDRQTGGPVTAAVVTAVSPAGEVLASAVSDPDGSYRLAGFEAGSITLVAATTTADPVATVVDFDPEGTAPQREVDLAIDAPAGIGGTITESGDPVGGLPLTLHDTEGRAVATTFTEDDGSYRFEGIKPGTYTLRSHPSAPRVTPVAAGASRADVTLPPAG